MIRIMIIEDAEQNMNLLKRVLEYCKEEKVIVAYTDSSTGIQEVQRLKPDVFFFDIGIYGINWTQAIKELMDDNITVIFVTTYQHFIESFRDHADDYIFKLVTKEEVCQVLDKVRTILTMQSKDDTTSLTIRFFGGLHVYYKGIELDWPTEKTAELFAYLVCQQGTKVSKFQLGDILWPNVAFSKAIRNVYNSIYLLKKVFEKANIQMNITNNKGYYEMKLYDVKMDFQELDLFVNNQPHLDHQSVVDYEKIEQLYTGKFLLGKEYSWHTYLQVHYHQWYIRTVQEMLEYYLQNNEGEKAIMLGQKVLAHNPQEETIARILVPFYIEKSPRELLQFYRDYTARFEQEMRTGLSKETIDCFEESLRNTQDRS